MLPDTLFLSACFRCNCWYRSCMSVCARPALAVGVSYLEAGAAITSCAARLVPTVCHRRGQEQSRIRITLKELLVEFSLHGLWCSWCIFVDNLRLPINFPFVINSYKLAYANSTVSWEPESHGPHSHLLHWHNHQVAAVRDRYEAEQQKQWRDQQSCRQ